MNDTSKFIRGLMWENDQLLKLLQRCHDEMDDANADYGTENNLCLFCNSNKWDSKKGVIHKEGCIILKLRQILYGGERGTSVRRQGSNSPASPRPNAGKGRITQHEGAGGSALRTAPAKT